MASFLDVAKWAVLWMLGLNKKEEKKDSFKRTTPLAPTPVLTPDSLDSAIQNNGLQSVIDYNALEAVPVLPKTSAIPNAMEQLAAIQNPLQSVQMQSIQTPQLIPQQQPLQSVEVQPIQDIPLIDPTLQTLDTPSLLPTPIQNTAGITDIVNQNNQQQVIDSIADLQSNIVDVQDQLQNTPEQSLAEQLVKEQNRQAAMEWVVSGAGIRFDRGAGVWAVLWGVLDSSWLGYLIPEDRPDAVGEAKEIAPVDTRLIDQQLEDFIAVNVSKYDQSRKIKKQANEVQNDLFWSNISIIKGANVEDVLWYVEYLDKPRKDQIQYWIEKGVPEDTAKKNIDLWFNERYVDRYNNIVDLYQWRGDRLFKDKAKKVEAQDYEWKTVASMQVYEKRVRKVEDIKNDEHKAFMDELMATPIFKSIASLDKDAERTQKGVMKSVWYAYASTMNIPLEMLSQAYRNLAKIKANPAVPPSQIAEAEKYVSDMEKTVQMMRGKLMDLAVWQLKNKKWFGVDLYGLNSISWRDFVNAQWFDSLNDYMLAGTPLEKMKAGKFDVTFEEWMDVLANDVAKIYYDYSWRPAVLNAGLKFLNTNKLVNDSMFFVRQIGAKLIPWQMNDAGVKWFGNIRTVEQWGIASLWVRRLNDLTDALPKIGEVVIPFIGTMGKASLAAGGIRSLASWMRAGRGAQLVDSLATATKIGIEYMWIEAVAQGFSTAGQSRADEQLLAVGLILEPLTNARSIYKALKSPIVWLNDVQKLTLSRIEGLWGTKKVSMRDLNDGVATKMIDDYVSKANARLPEWSKQITRSDVIKTVYAGKRVSEMAIAAVDEWIDAVDRATILWQAAQGAQRSLDALSLRTISRLEEPSEEILTRAKSLLESGQMPNQEYVDNLKQMAKDDSVNVAEFIKRDLSINKGIEFLWYKSTRGTTANIPTSIVPERVIDTYASKWTDFNYAKTYSAEEKNNLINVSKWSDVPSLDDADFMQRGDGFVMSETAIEKSGGKVRNSAKRVNYDNLKESMERVWYSQWQIDNITNAWVPERMEDLLISIIC